MCLLFLSLLLSFQVGGGTLAASCDRCLQIAREKRGGGGIGRPKRAG